MKQRKTGRRRLQSPMLHTGIVLPADLLERLKNDGQRSGRGLAAEIRQRLQGSYDEEGARSRDPRMATLIERIKKLADGLHRDIGLRWYQTKFNRNALLAGIGVFLSEFDAEDERVSDTPFRGYPDDASADVVGQAHARFILRGQQQKEYH